MFNGLIRELEKGDIEEVENIFGMYWESELKNHFLKRVRDFINSTPEAINQKYRYLVAVENGEVVGVAALRKVPEFMKKFTTTENPAEFYIAAVKYKGKGIGTSLRTERLKLAIEMGFTEVVFFSAESHKDSWNFHDNSDFHRIGETQAPNGEKGYVWGRLLK